MQIHGKHSEARSTVRSSQSVKTEHDNAKRSASIPPKEPPTREIQSQLQQVYSERISGNADCRIPHPKGHVVDYGAGQQEIRILPFMINEGVAYPLPIPLGSDFKSKLQESIRLGDPSKRLAKKLASLTVDQTQTLQTVLQPLSGSPGRKLVELAFVTKSTHKFWRKSSKVPIAFVEDRQSDMPYGISRLEAPIDMESKLLDSSIPLNTMDPVSNRNHTSQINLMTDSPEHKAENLANAAMHSNYSMPRVSGRQNIISRLQTTTPIPPNLGLLGFQNLEDFLIDEKEWLERFTEYGAWTIRPALTSDSTRTPPADWDRCVLSQEIMNISQIKLRLAVLDKAPPSVVEKLSALNLSQQLQVTRTIEEAAKAGYNTTPSRYWKLRQLDVIRARRLFKPKRVESIIVYVSKEPPAEAIRTRDRWPANTYGTRQGAMWQGNQVNDDYRGIYSTHPDGYATAPGAGQFNGDPWQPYWHPHRHPYFPLVQPPGYHSDVRRTGNAIRRPYHTAPVQYDSYSDQASRRSPSRLTDYSPTSFSRRIHSRRRRFSDESNDSYKKSSSFDSEDGSPSSDTEEWSSQDSASTSSVFRRQPEPSIHGPNQLDEDVQTRSPGKQRKHRPTEHGQPGEAIGSSADRGDESEEDTEAQAEASRQQQNNTDKTLQLRSEGHLVQRSSYFMHGRNRIGPSDHSNTRSISRNHQKLIDHTDDNDVFRGRPRERVGYPTQFDNQPYDPHAIDLEAVEKLLLEWTPHHQLESNENKAAIPQPRDQEIRAPLAKIEQGEIDGRSRQELEIIEDDRKQETMPSDSRSKPTTIPDNDGPAHHDQNLGRPAYVEDFVDDQAEAPKISKHEEQFEDAMEYIQQTSSIPLAMSKLLDGPSMPGPASGNAKDSMHLSPGASASPNPSPHFKLLGYSKDDKYEPLREESSPNIENYSRFASPLYMASPVQTPIPETSPAPTPVYETSMAPTPANIPSPAPTPKNQLPCITRGREQKGDWGPEKPKSKHPLSTANTPAEDSFSIQARLFRKGDDSKRAATFPTSIRQPWMDIEWAKQIVGDTASIAEGNEVEPELPRQRDRRPQDKKVILEGKSAHHAFRRHARRLELDDHDSAHSSPRKQGKRLTTRHGSSRQSPRRQDRKSDVKQDSARHSPRGTDRILGLERDSARSSPRRNKTLPKRHKESPRRRLTGRPSLPPQGNSQLVKHDFDHASLARRFDPPRRRQTIEFEPKAGQRHVPEHTKISEKRRRSSSPDDRATGRRHAPNRAHTWVYDKEREKELNRKIERRASHGV
ncbi:hypothetical protein F5Y18DRAFT_28874 [Xylariaceae sp. FL1019]|nr:hypothetical protein F5Y18DRAFT_28874 [Xylariaceae sp. FL1019]